MCENLYNNGCRLQLSKMSQTKKEIKLASSHINELREKILHNSKRAVDVTEIIEWLNKKRKKNSGKSKLVPISQLADWVYSEQEGIVRHKKGSEYFFSVQGVVVSKAHGTEVTGWNQPIIVQKEGGYLVILCQERDNQIKFLLHAKFEAGNIDRVQLGPTIQATHSNLNQHHSGRKPVFSEYIENHPETTLIYTARHNEEGARFWEKSNINRLILLNPDVKLPLKKSDDFIWLTLDEIKKLMLYDHVVNPFVKTILSPL